MHTKTLTNSVSGGALSKKRTMALFSVGREIAVLAGLQILFFLALALLEPRFLFVHLYELLPYVVILVFFAYGRTRWVYLIGPLVSLIWLLLAYNIGLFQASVERARHLHGAPTSTDVVALLALATAAVAVLMIILCRVHWLKEFSGRGRALPVVLGSLAIAVVYYASLLHWFWAMMRKD